MNTLAPVALFAFNRPAHTKFTLEALAKNEYASDTEIFAFCDGPRRESDFDKVAETRQIIHEARGFKRVEIFESKTNLGLANSIISGITKVIEKFGRIIVLEDDIICHHLFLKFMNEGLEFYKTEPGLYSISGYRLPIHDLANNDYDIYFTRRHSSWGWGTWLRCWQGIDWEIKDYQRFRRDKHARASFSLGGEDFSSMLDAQLSGKIDSWAIRFNYHCWKKNAISAASISNMIENIGFDGSGKHCQPSGKFQSIPLGKMNVSFRFDPDVKLDPLVEKQYRLLFRVRPRTRILGLIRRLLKMVS